LRNLQKSPKKAKKPDVAERSLDDDGEDKENEKETFAHPVYNQISRKNGYLNRQDLSTLKRICKEENIDSSGKKDLVSKRLKQYFKVKLLKEAGILDHVNRGFDYLVVVDFEATCEDKRSEEFPHEIIEFPAILVDVVSCKIVSEWRRFVRPVLNPILSQFCTDLTGISQETVDKSDEFPAVLNQFQDWLSDKKLGTEYTFGLVTDGPCDVGRFLRLSCQHYSLPVPDWASRWINIRKAFANFYRQGGKQDRSPGLQLMLSKLDLEFQGNLHSGLDDAINIGRVTERLLRDGATLRVNERIVQEVLKEEKPAPNKNTKVRRLPQVAPVYRKEAEDWLNRCKKLSSAAQKKTDFK